MPDKIKLTLMDSLGCMLGPLQQMDSSEAGEDFTFEALHWESYNRMSTNVSAATVFLSYAE